MYLNVDTQSFAKALEEIKELIKDKFHSQAKLGEEIFYGRKTINRILNNPGDVETFFQILKALGITNVSVK